MTRPWKSSARWREPTRAGSGQQAARPPGSRSRKKAGATDFLVGYETTETTGAVKAAIVVDGVEVESATGGQTVDVLPDRTSFYAEKRARPAGDTGKGSRPTAARNRVIDTQKQAGDLVRPSCRAVRGELKVGDQVVASVDAERRHTTPLQPLGRPPWCTPPCTMCWPATSPRSGRRWSTA
ncbi:alanine--tRNA ligase-related protein [Caulobacter segnis]